MCKVGAIILAGGKSERMGSPKAFLKYGNSTFLEKIVEAYLTAEIKPIVVVLNSEIFSESITAGIRNHNHIVFVYNPVPDRGRLYSIHLGLQMLKNEKYSFIQNVDNPSVNAALLVEMVKNRNSSGYVMPVYEKKGGHPILISKEIIEAIQCEKQPFSEEGITLRDVLKKFRKTGVAVDNNDILININNTQDYNNFIASMEPNGFQNMK